VTGSLALLLHAHLPFVRHPEHPIFLEESWLFEAVTESYIPLLRMLQSLADDGLHPHFSVSISPTLCAMLADELLRERYLSYLDVRIHLAETECDRTRDDFEQLSLAQFYRDFFGETRVLYRDEWQCDLLQQFRQWRDRGAIELIASAATHAILPALPPDARAAQIALGCDVFRETFGGDSIGFWLPECAYTPGLDVLLAAQNLRWFVMDAPSLAGSKRGTFAPSFTPGGPAVFARNTEASRQVWDAQQGYPGDATYREFYRELPWDNSNPQPPSHPTGIKYYRVTGGDRPKEIYHPEVAAHTAREHARHFVRAQIAQLSAVNAQKWQPIIVAPFDAELFGHWWFEGPAFLEEVVREIARDTAQTELITCSDFLAANPAQQIVQPPSSSWGDGGFMDVWLDESCAWIFPRLTTAHARLQTLARRHVRNVSVPQERSLRQLARELLLAQASDWPFLIHNRTAPEYATKRVTDHLQRFDCLARSLESGREAGEFLAQCEAQDNLFPRVDWRKFI